MYTTLATLATTTGPHVTTEQRIPIRKTVEGRGYVIFKDVVSYNEAS
jgi:hypothetical protein